MNNGNVSNEEVLIMPGGAIKARGREIKADGKEIGKVGGVLCRFTNKDQTDWYGDFFDEATDFRFVEGMPCAVYFDHGCDSILGVKCLALGTLHMGADGIEIYAELDLSDADTLAIYERVEKDELGWSSGTAGHLVGRTQVKSYAVHGESAWHIDHWPLGLDASLTPWPAEPQNVASTIKSSIQSLKSRKAEGGAKEAITLGDKTAEAIATDAIKMELAAIEREALILQADLILLSVR